MTLIFNPEKVGLSKVFKDYQAEAVKFVWEIGDRGTISREVWATVNERLVGKTISRASIINFLNAMVNEGVLDYNEETGKGGYHRVYRPKLDESSFKRHVAQVMVSSLMKDYPEETMEVIRSLQ
ncbi:hypothetical protein H8E65_11050 [Candidatus Bathyarchaeota archaeon]|nr:hypothetical protein [Candidatus Bathyarchaeota archaeon]